MSTIGANPGATVAAEIAAKAGSRAAAAPKTSLHARRPDGLAFALLLGALAVLLVRPSEIVPAVEKLRFYELLIAACCVFSLPVLAGQTLRHLRDRPLNVCVLGLLVAVVMSHLSNRFLWGARHSAVTFAKVVLIFFLIAGLTTTVSRMRKLLGWLVVFIGILTALALLQYYDVIDLPALRAYRQALFEIDNPDGQVPIVLRLCSTGIFNDPNDLCLILIFGAMLSMYWFGERRSVLLRLICLMATAMFIWALAMTHSRGGFLAMLAGFFTLVVARWGLKRALVPIILAAPILFTVFAGRQTNISATEGTGLARLQLWSEALVRFKGVPIFGMGMDQFAEEYTLVVHNSFLQCFVELGMFGGMLFLGAFVIAAISLRRLGQFSAPGVDASMVRLRPYLLAILAAYAIGLLSLSRAYTAPIYLLFGVIAAYLRLGTPNGLGMHRIGIGMLAKFVACSIAFLVATYVFLRLFVRWS